ncbi:MAG: prohibitin family protein [Ignavibacteria bacterium]|nr:prohibitin family protein [Ignavibacteria bacterium]
MLTILIFLIILLVITVFVKKQSAENKSVLKVIKILRLLIIIGIVLVIIFSSLVQIGPGEVGVPILFGSVQDNVLYSGLNIINPLMTVEIIDVKTQAYTMSVVREEGQRIGDDAITTLTSDGLTIKLDVTVWYRINAVEAPNVLRTIGLDYTEKIVRPAIRTALRDISVRYTATDIYSTKRNDFVYEVSKNLEGAFEGRSIILERVLLRNVELPEKVREAIDEKIAAEQRAQQMVYILQKEKQEAERKKVEATGIAEAQKIISNTINPQYLQWKYIETLKDVINSKNSTFIIAPYDQKLMPLLNLNK